MTQANMRVDAMAGFAGASVARKLAILLHRLWVTGEVRKVRVRRGVIFDKHAEGKLIEHWDEFNLLAVFQQIAATTVGKAERQ